MRMEQYLTITDHALWEVIVNGDSASSVALASAEGPIPPKTVKQKLARKNKLKAKSTLMLAIPDEHLLKLHACKDAKSLWEAIKNRFGGNKESKKMQKAILKQNYENFDASSQERLDKPMIAWNNIALIMRNKSDLDTLSMDDLYNNLKVYVSEIKGQSSSSSNSKKVAFVSSDNTSSTNETVNTAHGVSAASSKNQASTASYADNVIFSFFSNQSNTSQTKVDCYNCHRRDGISGYDWSFQAKEELTNFALMAYTSQDKTGVGYDGHVNESEVLNNVVDSCKSDGDDNQVNDRFKKDKGYYAVPSPYIGNYMPLRADLSFAGLDNYVFKSKVGETTTSLPKIETSASKTDSKDENVFESKEVKKTVKPSLEKIKFVNDKNTTVENENKAAKPQMFSQSPREAWERFKEILRACPHHGFIELAQIDTFYNGLNDNDQDSLNAAAGENLLSKTAREALQIIKNKSKVRYSISKPNVSRMNTNSRKNVSKTNDMIDKLADQISTLVDIFAKKVVTPAPVKAIDVLLVVDLMLITIVLILIAINQVFVWLRFKGEFKNEIQNTMKTQQTVLMEQQNAFQNNSQNMLSGFFHNQSSTSGTLPSNTIPNPKGEMKAITTRSGVAYEGPSIPSPKMVMEREAEETTDKEQTNSKEGKLFELAKIPLNMKCSAMLLKKLPEKLGDPGKLLIPCDFPGMDVCHALADLGASINLISLSIWKKLSLPELTPTRMTLELADRSITRPEGVAEDVFVKVGKFHFPTDFVVVDFEADPRVSLILGRSFLRTGRALIDVFEEEITLLVNDEAEILGFFNNSSGGNPASTSERILSDSSPSLTPFKGSDFILEEIEAYLKDESISSKIDHADYDSEGDICLIEKLLNDDPFQLPPMNLKQGEVVKSVGKPYSFWQSVVNAAKQRSHREATSVGTARHVNTVASRPNVNTSLPTTYSYFKAHSPVIDGGFLHLEEMLKEEKLLKKKNNVLFTDTECVVLSPGFKLLDESQVLLKVPRNNKMYSFDLKNVVPVGGLTCLFAKATLDESNLWHRRLGRINFKTMNKLVRGNPVRGLLSELFENDHTCVACQKGKQHKASFVTDTKDETPEILKNFIAGIENQIDHKENLHINFLENKPNVAGTRPNWMFDIDTLAMSMNYQPVFAGNQTNGNAGPKNSETEVANDVGKKSTKVQRMENGVQDPVKEGEKNDQGKDLRDQEEALRKQLEQESERFSSFTTIDPRKERAQRNEFESIFRQDKDANGNSMFTPVSADGYTYVNLGGSIHVNAATLPNVDLPTDPLMPDLEDTIDLQDTRIFSGAYDDEVEGAMADFNNLELTTVVSPIPTTKIYKDHPKEQIIRDPLSALKTRRMTKTSQEHAMVSYIKKQDWLHKSAFLYGTIEEEVYVCQPLSFEDPHFRNKVYKVEKALYGLHQAPKAWYETLSTYLLENGFRRGIIDKTLFIKKDKGDILLVQVYVHDIIFGSTKKSLCTEFEGLMHKKFQMSLWGSSLSSYGCKSCRKMMEFLSAKTITPKVLRLYAVKRIFRYLKGQPKLGLWYPRDSPFDLEAFSDSDYAGASLDRKSTTGGY
uniref:Reverse transcriptase domain-containing protein n=1 Tax=Tanacetum cinerariifolium TaxID=118510 RepID=A0A6L2NBJ6_TANCI|nr:reverse transcriptase domain-containing protein [Tanacetum cinerariifolium]